MKKLLATALLATLAAPAFAADGSALLQQGLQVLNNTNSGAAPAAAPALPTSLDQLKSKAIAKASLYAIDTDHSGTVSRAELNALNDKVFAYADKNGDGQLTEEELSTFGAEINKALSFLK